MMNEKAKDLGLKDTHFVSSHGLDNELHYTTAYELAKIADYALNLEKFSEVVGTKTYIITINGYPRTITNTNELLGYVNGVNGVKTGFTNKAGRCLVTSALRSELNIITVVLGADTKRIRSRDSIALIEYVYENYEQVNLKRMINEKFKEWKKRNEKNICVNKGVKNRVSIEIGETKYEKYSFEKEKIKDIKIEINCVFYMEAPVEKGTVIGNVKLKLGDNIIEEVDIKVREKIKKKKILDYFWKFFSNYDIIVSSVIN